ncbi:MAG: hypothetical protein SCALA702_36060 [Melioribacteraceae bacterium]|nr:MAG: hypothetical protein SCALA702_36060 [Melioribacteraceae bacterium]
MRKLILLTYLAASFIVSNLSGQNDVGSPLLTFNRGKLWQSIYLGKVGPGIFSNWRTTGIGLDWPGFDPSWINENIGGSPSHLLTGGFWVGCKTEDDSVLAVEDWSIYASSIGTEASSKYIIRKHRKVENYQREYSQNGGDEIIETVWEYNPLYQTNFDAFRQLPLRVSRNSHQWNGSKDHENYIIHEYIFENISDELKSVYPNREIVDTLYEFNALLNYAIHSNSRAWAINYPSLTPGARNTWYFPNIAEKMVYARADKYEGVSVEPQFGWAPSLGPVVNGSPTGEFTAPGFVAVKMVYSTPNKSNQESFVRSISWDAGDNAQDYQGPMTGKGTIEDKYEVIIDPSKSSRPVSSPGDPLMRSNRMWSLMSLGSWDIAPGDSVIIVVAEMVNGADYKFALDEAQIPTLTRDGLAAINLDAKFINYDYANGLNHPDPPIAPEFTVSFDLENRDELANVLKWSDASESIPDPDDGLLDLTGYKVYRSSYLPIGPWTLIKDISRGDLEFYSGADGEYTFKDTAVKAGDSYYYALTVYDSGRVAWNINPAAIHPVTGNSSVPVLESSIFANRKVQKFTTTFPPANSLDEILVVPNPFVIGEGSSVPGEGDRIQFVNIPNPCTIRIYTVRGDLVKTIEVADGAGAIAEWDQVTDFGQFIESGIYIFHVDSPKGTKVDKFAVVR